MLNINSIKASRKFSSIYSTASLNIMSLYSKKAPIIGFFSSENNKETNMSCYYIAQEISSHSKKVLLVDCDVETSHIFSMISEEQPLSGEKFLITKENDHLDVVCLAEHMPDQVSANSLREFVSEHSEFYDYIFIRFPIGTKGLAYIKTCEYVDYALITEKRFQSKYANINNYMRQLSRLPTTFIKYLII